MSHFAFALLGIMTLTAFNAKAAGAELPGSLIGRWAWVERSVSETFSLQEITPMADSKFAAKLNWSTMDPKCSLNGYALVGTRIDGGLAFEATTRCNISFSATLRASESGGYSGKASVAGGNVELALTTKIAEVNTMAKQLASNSPTIKSPAPDVPASCAPFVGVWTGNWPGFGQTWLWVTEVDVHCVAKVAHRTVPKIYSADVLKEIEIKNGALSVPDDHGDTDVFVLSNDVLSARHIGSGSNTTAFRRVVTESK